MSTELIEILFPPAPDIFSDVATIPNSLNFSSNFSSSKQIQSKQNLSHRSMCMMHNHKH